MHLSRQLELTPKPDPSLRLQGVRQISPGAVIHAPASRNVPRSLHRSHTAKEHKEGGFTNTPTTDADGAVVPRRKR